MNFKTPFKVLTTAALIGTLAVSTVAPGAASAATNTTVSAKAEVAQDIKSVVLKKGDDSITLSYNDYASAQGSKVLEGYVVTHVVADNGAVYDYETYGLAYSKGATTTEVFKKLADAEASTTEVPAEAKEASFNEDGELVVSTPTEEDFKVTEIAAITDTLKKAADQQLGFKVNGEEADLAKLKEEGYTVTYKFNKTGLTATADGKIDLSTTSLTSFEYQVVATPKEGEAVTSEWKAVKVVDATVTTAVTKVGLVDATGKEWKQTVLDGKVKFSAAEYTNALGEKNTDKENPFDPTGDAKPNVESAESSDITVAYYDAGVIKVIGDGEVTFKVKFENIKDPVEIKVNVASSQEIKSIKAEDVKVKAGEATAVKFNVLDANKEAYLADTNNKIFTTVTAAGKTEADKAVAAPATTTGEVTLTGNEFAKGETVVNVYADADKKVKLGSFTVTGVDVSGNPDKYTLVLAEDEKPEFDLKADASPADKTVTLKADAFVNDVAVNLPKDTDYKVVAKSSNENIAANLDVDTKTVTVSAADTTKLKAGDTADIQLVLVEGAKETKIGDVVTVTVKNTTKQITTLTLKEDTLVQVTTGDLKAAVVAAVKEGTGDNAITTAMIADATYVKANKAVVVTIESLNGGKKFTLAATDKRDLETAIDEATEAEVSTTEATKVLNDLSADQAKVDAATKTLKEATATAKAEAEAAVKAGTAKAADYKTLTGLTVNDVEVATLNAYLKTATVKFYEATNAADTGKEPAKQSIADAVAGVKAATSLTPVQGDSFTDDNGTTLTKYTLPNLDIKTTTLAALISTKGTNPTSVLLIDDNGDLHVTNDGTKRVLYALKKDKSGQGAVATTWVKFEITPAQAQ